MLENKFGELFEESQVSPAPQSSPSTPTPLPLGPFIIANGSIQPLTNGLFVITIWMCSSIPISMGITVWESSNHGFQSICL